MRVGGGLLAGGGMQTGQVIGATDRLGAEIADRPVHFGEVLASLYCNIGVDPGTLTLSDLSGRPQYLLEHAEPLAEFVCAAS